MARDGDGMNLQRMYEDQRQFNRQIYSGGLGCPADTETGMERLRVLALGMVEEALEFLRTFEWKTHRRRQGKLQNVAHSHEELVDMFKYWLSCAEFVDFPIDRLEELYYAKSRVVQYRYQEEWMQTIDGPCVLVDIDNVIGDYITGICHFAKQHAQTVLGLSCSSTMNLVHKLDELQRTGGFVRAESTGLSASEFNQIKHAFRTQGGKRTLPLFDDSRPFLSWCRKLGRTIILVTSRPIDRYPNIFTDTLTWLHNNDLPFDYLWWADDKARRLEEYASNLRSHVVFAVDDDLQFVNQYLGKGIKTYWLNRRGQTESSNGLLIVRSLTQIIVQEGEDDGQLR